MGKVLESHNFDVLEANGDENTYTVLMDCAEEGYGVEYSDREAVITSWSFGDNSVESYILSEKLFRYTTDILEKLTKQQNNLGNPNMPIVEAFLPGALISAGFSIDTGKPSEEQEKDVMFIVYLLERYYGEPPLKEEEVEKVRKDFNWPKEKSLWSHLVQRTV
ncbi:hypothetical protein CN918_31625 [Priestia megaterium]|nr:hypothetical protein CN918_31625 [Priestia megaterium]